MKVTRKENNCLWLSNIKLTDYYKTYLTNTFYVDNIINDIPVEHLNIKNIHELEEWELKLKKIIKKYNINSILGEWTIPSIKVITKYINYMPILSPWNLSIINIGKKPKISLNWTKNIIETCHSYGWHILENNNDIISLHNKDKIGFDISIELPKNKIIINDPQFKYGIYIFKNNGIQLGYIPYRNITNNIPNNIKEKLQKYNVIL